MLHQNNHILFVVINHAHHHRRRNSLEQGGAVMCTIATSSSKYTQEKKLVNNMQMRRPAPPSKQCAFPAWKNASTNSMQFHAYAAGTYTLLNPRINRSTRATPDHGCGVSTWSEEHWRRLEVSEPLKHELDRLSPSYTCLNNPELPVFLCWCSDLSISRHYFPHLHGCGQRCYKFTRLELVSECQLPECLLYIAMSSS